jgi:hypothetical protein
MMRPAAYVSAPTEITRKVPNRSAIAPATGWPIPHSRFWMAKATAESEINASAWKSQGQRNPKDSAGLPLQGSPANLRAPARSYRFALACSAELCAASASLADISAVWAGVPQLGASLPSPQARGR